MCTQYTLLLDGILIPARFLVEAPPNAHELKECLGYANTKDGNLFFNLWTDIDPYGVYIVILTSFS